MDNYSVIEMIADEMRDEAKSLRNDTLTSMSESVCNERIADGLEKWADRLSFAVDDLQSSFD